MQHAGQARRWTFLGESCSPFSAKLCREDNCPSNETKGTKNEGTKAVRIKACLFAVAIALEATTVVNAQYFERPSSFFLEAGAGFYPYLTYGPAVDSTLSGSSTSRFQLDLEARLGWEVARRLYLVGGYDGVLDEIFTNGTWVNQISSGLISAGFRLYPFGSGLIVEADAGLSELNGFAVLGYGFGGTIAWDFSSLGVNAEVGARTLYIAFQYTGPSSMFAVMPFVAILIR